MEQIVLQGRPLFKAQIPEVLKDHGIAINHLAETFLSHPAFSAEPIGTMRITVAALKEIGLANGGTLREIRRQAAKRGLRACPACTGLFLRLAWRDQPESENAVLSGTHHAPDQAVTVLSGELERDDAFPKGLYLRNVDGTLWLRGYTCDADFVFSGDDLFAFDTAEVREAPDCVSCIP